MDPRLRDNFIERVFIYHRWHCYCAAGMTPAALADFHTRHKFSVFAHSEPAYHGLGRLVADVGRGDIDEIAATYIRLLMRALARIATAKQHADGLMHIMGLFEELLDSNDKAELLDRIEDYRQQKVPLIVPITLGLASKLIHILERRSIPPSRVVRRFNRLAMRTPLALLDGHLNAPKCKLISTRALIHHHLRCHPDDYINSLYYLNPHPRESMLRNRI